MKMCSEQGDGASDIHVCLECSDSMLSLDMYLQHWQSKHDTHICLTCNNIVHGIHSYYTHRTNGCDSDKGGGGGSKDYDLYGACSSKEEMLDSGSKMKDNDVNRVLGVLKNAVQTLESLVCRNDGLVSCVLEPEENRGLLNTIVQLKTAEVDQSDEDTVVDGLSLGSVSDLHVI